MCVVCFIFVVVVDVAFVEHTSTVAVRVTMIALASKRTETFSLFFSHHSFVRTLAAFRGPPMALVRENARETGPWVSSRMK